MATRTWYTTCTSSDWPNPEHRSNAEKNCPYLKGLPPSHHLIGKSHSITNYDVTCGRGVLFPINYWTPHRGLKIKNREKRTLNCLRQRVWLDVSTFDQCLFTTKQIGFVLILICETSQIFVWRNKAFIFLQKSDIILLMALLAPNATHQISSSHCWTLARQVWAVKVPANSDLSIFATLQEVADSCQLVQSTVIHNLGSTIYSPIVKLRQNTLSRVQIPSQR